MRPMPADDPIAVGLLDEYFAMRAATFPSGATYTPARPSAAVFTPPAGVFLVVFDDDGAPVGCGGVRRIEDGPGGIRFEVKHLYLAPSTRGRGWGRMLLRALENSARAEGATELVLDTHHTLTAAGSLYASEGFTPIEPYNDNPNATRWYGMQLAP